MNQITLLFFANLRELVGTKEVSLSITDSSTVADLKSQVADLYPQLSSHLKTTLVSVNKEYGFDEEIIPVGAEVALFPPVSGGSGSQSSDFPTYLAIQEGERVLVHRVEKRKEDGTAEVFIIKASPKDLETDH